MPKKIIHKKKSHGICNFLLSLLEDESYPRVSWTNKEKGEFQIHWMHASSGAWEMNTDAETFRLWAEAKGKLEGRENNYKVWKANFRCAMKSRVELEEIPIPKDSVLRNKNLKLWKFKDTEVIKRYKEGEKFDWRCLRTKPALIKSVRIRNSKTKRNKKVLVSEEKLQSEESQSPRPHFNTYEELQSTDTEETDASLGTGLLRILDRSNENTDILEPNMPIDERLETIDAEGDNSCNPFGVGLLTILEHDDKIRGPEVEDDAQPKDRGSRSGPSAIVLPDNKSINLNGKTFFRNCNHVSLLGQTAISFGSKESHPCGNDSL